MSQLPDALRVTLSGLRVCRANGIAPRVLVPAEAESWFSLVESRGGSIEEDGARPDAVVSFGRRFLGAPYDAHATVADAPNTFSCSSLARYAFAYVGISMARYAVDQSYQGRSIDATHPIPMGMLAFWKSEFPIRDPSRTVGHVAISLGDGQLLHAGGERRDVHVFLPQRATALLAVDPFPEGPSLLIHLPSNRRDLETALDVARWLQR